ncbi:MAG: galactokinase family protein [Oscillospiraceae bacterium]|nr:galactokinase family protein [Oscillospiraceae bacterium]
MSNICLLMEQISKGTFDSTFELLYGKDKGVLCYQRKRYLDALLEFSKLYPQKTDVCIFSAPGRTEICGNHTDHNNGKTLSAAINLDAIAVAAKDEQSIEVCSQGFAPDRIELCDIEYKENEKNSSRALIKGVCSGFNERGFKYGGFVTYTTSDVLKGSGISSSAAFEVLLCTIENYFYNNSGIDAVTIAKIAQYAENKFFGKPCGLLDQISSSVGGFITADFESPNNPEIEKIEFDFEKSGYVLCIVNTGGSHEDSTHEYAAIPAEMKAVAEFFGKQTLRELKREDIRHSAKVLREKIGDRAILRAMHFFDENDRVDSLSKALNENDFSEALKQIRRSGRSSFMYLQNVYSSTLPAEQGLSLALSLSDSILEYDGAFRVHGGGFGGTIEAFVPKNMLTEYKKCMDDVFGEGACIALNIRKQGGTLVIE